MSKICTVCGKRPVMGRSICRRGMAKRKGGAGQKITGISHRLFRPNVQRVKVLINGTRKYVYVCTKCLKAGKVRKAPRRSKP